MVISGTEGSVPLHPHNIHPTPLVSPPYLTIPCAVLGEYLRCGLFAASFPRNALMFTPSRNSP